MFLHICISHLSDVSSDPDTTDVKYKSALDIDPINFEKYRNLETFALLYNKINLFLFKIFKLELRKNMTKFLLYFGIFLEISRTNFKFKKY